jgi:hypothetical protein
MPYISKEKRMVLDPLISEIANIIIHGNKEMRAQALYDTVYYLALENRGDGKYRNWNELSGALMCMSAELRRRMTSHIPRSLAYTPEEARKRWGPFPTTISPKTPLAMKLTIEKLALAVSHLDRADHEEVMRKTLALKNIPRPHEPIIESLMDRLPVERAGNLNYAMTKLCVLLNPANDAGDWLAIEDILAGAGWLPHRLFQELYTRYIGEYEDKKVIDHGDVYPPPPDLTPRGILKRKKFLGLF